MCFLIFFYCIANYQCCQTGIRFVAPPKIANLAHCLLLPTLLSLSQFCYTTIGMAFPESWEIAFRKSWQPCRSFFLPPSDLREVQSPKFLQSRTLLHLLHLREIRRERRRRRTMHERMQKKSFHSSHMAKMIFPFLPPRPSQILAVLDLVWESATCHLGSLQLA